MRCAPAISLPAHPLDTSFPVQYAQLEEQSQRRLRRAKSDPGELQRTLPVGRTFDYKLRLSIKGHVDISITLEKVSWNV